jgi:preprotein translocase subunit SecB
MNSTINQYAVENILLTKLVFERASTIQHGHPEEQAEISVQVKHQQNEQQLFVFCGLQYRSILINQVQLHAIVEMVATFIIPQNPPIAIEEFAKINAPAIMYPFLRETLATNAQKAGVPNLFIPLVNFTEKS